MKRLKIAFDVDGTLRCNCTDSCLDPNESVVAMFNALTKTKNVDLYVWSGGGDAYAKRYARWIDLPVRESRCISKVGAPQMDIAFDDQHEFALATHNIIVRAK